MKGGFTYGQMVFFVSSRDTFMQACTHVHRHVPDYCCVLPQVAHMGVTVCAVIHQPSYGIFRMFDDLLLLCKGGRTAYYGRQTAVQVRTALAVHRPRVCSESVSKFVGVKLQYRGCHVHAGHACDAILILP